MRRLVLVAVALFATLLWTAAGSAASGARPALAMHVGSSTVVTGTHFRPHERVKVTSTTGASASVRANSRGSFTTTLHGVPVDRCSALVVQARGSEGSFATARRPPPPDCAPI